MPILGSGAREFTHMRVAVRRESSLPLGLVAILLFCFCCSTASAQVQTGRIVGTIYDPNKAVIPGASVTVKDLATNVTRQVVTNDSGDYVVTPLDPGTYSVSVTASGFETTVRSGIELSVGQA